MIDESMYMVDAQGRHRFFGIYSAEVVSINDPLKKNRIQVLVHQPTGKNVTAWAAACLPVTSNANHPDHQEHTAAQVAALLTTTPITISGSGGDPQGGSVSVSSSVPALTVVPKSGAGTLKHPHKTARDKDQRWNDVQEPLINTTDEHTPHRMVPWDKNTNLIMPGKGQQVWVMFEAGLLEHPVWIGVKP